MPSSPYLLGHGEYRGRTLHQTWRKALEALWTRVRRQWHKLLRLQWWICGELPLVRQWKRGPHAWDWLPMGCQAAKAVHGGLQQESSSFGSNLLCLIWVLWFINLLYSSEKLFRHIILIVGNFKKYQAPSIKRGNFNWIVLFDQFNQLYWNISRKSTIIHSTFKYGRRSKHSVQKEESCIPQRQWAFVEV